MNRNLPTLVALLLVCVTLQAQIKDTYQDTSSGLTTVVVKEDAANDMDILNNQFDMDEVGMHQVIRITTRKEVDPEDAPISIQSADVTHAAISPSALNLILAPAEAPILTASIGVIPTLITESPIIINTVKTTKEELTSDESMEVVATIAKAKVAESSRSTKSYEANQKTKNRTFKKFDKRFKKQQRKRIRKNKRKKNRCYSF